MCTGELHCSSGEKAVMDVLDDTWMLDFHHDSTYVVSNSSMLRWGFIILSPKGPVFIEYDGIAHFQPVRFGNYTYVQAIKNLKRQQENDYIKNEFCEKNKYPLLRIPYWKKDQIPELVSDFLIMTL